jgi:hypothetical protein
MGQIIRYGSFTGSDAASQTDNTHNSIAHRKKEGRRKKEEGRGKKEEGRGKKEEGRRKKEEGRRKK